MSPIFALSKILVLFLALEFVRAEVTCNSSAPGQEGGTCTGDYCFNVDNLILGCVNFYREIHDKNIACGNMNLMGQNRRMCICTQAYCGKYNVNDMPQQTLARVNCTDNTELGYCSPGPCYVGNDLPGFHPNAPLIQQTCVQDWIAMTNFKEMIFYEAPQLANHSACFFSDDKFNCYCKDPECNAKQEPPVLAADDPAVHHYTCHKMACRADVDENCTEQFLGNQTCVGQICYFLKNRYDFEINGHVLNETNFVRDCMNYSYANPLEDLTFATGFEFGKSMSVFEPCTGDWCNTYMENSTTPVPATNATDPVTTTPAPGVAAQIIPSILTIFSAAIMIFHH